ERAVGRRKKRDLLPDSGDRGAGGSAGGSGGGVATPSHHRRGHQGQARRGDTLRPDQGVTRQMRWLYGLEQPELTGATLAEGWGDGAVAD
ncbi:MAG TPA: hypothetical protein VGC48_05225, partial [Gemmatimonadales bacterium]